MDFLSEDGIADLLIVEADTAEHNLKWFASLLDSLGLLESSIENARSERAQKTATLSLADNRLARLYQWDLGHSKING